MARKSQCGRTSIQRTIFLVVGAVFIVVFFCLYIPSSHLPLQPKYKSATVDASVFGVDSEDMAVQAGRKVVQYWRFGADGRALDDGRKLPPNYGVFVVLDLMAEKPHDKTDIEFITDHEFGFSNCDQTNFGGYNLHIIHIISPGNSLHSERRRLVGAYVTEIKRQVTSRGCTVTLKEVEVTDVGQAATTLNAAMMDAYLDDAVDYFYVALPEMTSTDSSPPSRSLRHMAYVLRRSTNPVDHGLVVIRRAEKQQQQQQPRPTPLAFFLGRAHFDVFGVFFPPSLAALPAAVSHLVDLYTSVNMSVSVIDDVSPTATHPLYRDVSWSRDVTPPKPTAAAAAATDVMKEDLTALHRYLTAVNKSPCFRCLAPPSPRGLKVIVMSLYGSGRRYTMGAVRNAQLAPVNYPGWRLRFFAEPPGPAVKYGAVPAGIVARLRQLGAEIKYVEAASAGLAPMLWRFTVVEDPTIEMFIVRDCDSRLTPRDAAVVADWLRQPVNASLFHCIRDHPSHSGYSISGGLWGGRRAALAALFNGSFISSMAKYGGGYIEDMNFLGRDVWPRVQSVAYCHDSFSCSKWPASHAFPVQRIGSEHLGQVYDQLSVGRQVDIDLLVGAAVAAECIPQPSAAPAVAPA